MNLSDAMDLMQRARAHADYLGVRMNIAIVDEGANLMAFCRMDGAWLGSIDIAIKKARTAALFTMNTGLLGVSSQPGCSLYGIEHSNDGLITFPGGIWLPGQGAIGVSGGAVEQDEEVARACQLQ